MDKDNIINLTKIVYKLSLLFPKKEPLRYKIRELADNILSNWIRYYDFNQFQNNSNNQTNKIFLKEIIKEINVLDSFLEIVQSQQWVSRDDILAIQREYANLNKKIITKIIELKENKEEQKNNQLELNSTFSKKRNSFNERWEKIIDFLKKNKKVQVWQIKEIMPEITKRTLRRDFEALLKKGLVERIGEKNNTFYQLKI